MFDLAEKLLHNTEYVVQSDSTKRNFCRRQNYVTYLT